MMDKFFPVFLIFFAAFPAWAQSPLQNCALRPELIFEMGEAEYGAYNVWDAVYGEMNTDEGFSSGVVVESGNVVAAGEKASFGKEGKVLQLVEFDQRGRVVWEAEHAVEGLFGIKKMLSVPGGFAVMGTVKDKKSRSSVWLGFFDRGGKILDRKKIEVNGNSLLPDDVILQTDGKGFLLSAAEGDEKKEIFHAVLYHLDMKGRVKDRQSYMPGLDNRVSSISPVGKNQYIASGYLRGEDGRITGWMLRLNADGSLVWQRQYPRGSMAGIVKSMAFTGENVLAVGETKPSGGGLSAGWVMMIDGGTGDVIWQRYYTADMNQSAIDILVNMEGLASVMLAVTKTLGVENTEGKKDYIRLLTVNARGELAKSDEYFSAEGAQAAQMIGGRAGERIVLGRSDIVYKIEPKPGAAVETLRHGWNGWVTAGAPMESFDDPCLQSEAFRP